MSKQATKIDENMKKLIFFYEAHDDKLPTQVIQQLMPTFASMKIRAFAIEDPCDAPIISNKSMKKNIQNNKTNVHNNIKCINQLFQAKKMDELKKLFENLEIGISGDYNTKNVREAINTYQKYQSDREETILLLPKVINECKLAGIQPFNMDVNNKIKGIIQNDNSDRNWTKIREDFMVKQIQSKLQELPNDAGILILVGANHYGIASHFKTLHGMQVKEYYFDTSTMEERNLAQHLTSSEISLEHRLIQEFITSYNNGCVDGLYTTPQDRDIKSLTTKIHNNLLGTSSTSTSSSSCTIPEASTQNQTLVTTDKHQGLDTISSIESNVSSITTPMQALDTPFSSVDNSQLNFSENIDQVDLLG